MVIDVMCLCPLCEATDLVEMSERLIRPTDELLHDNEHYRHYRRGRLNLLVRTKENIQAEKVLPEYLLLDHELMLN